MTFLLSKLLWMIAQPSNFLLLVAFACSLLALDVRRRKPGVIAAIAMTMLVVAAVLPVGLWLRQPLEDRFPRPQALPDEVAGIIILGGAQQPHITLVRGTLALNDRAERLIEGLALAGRYPDARILLAGGSGAIGGVGGSEGDVNRVFARLMDLAPERVIHEEQSRNTFENAQFSWQLIQPDDDENWILVTSAAHMPRSMGIFRKLGWNVIPWPVDYQTSGDLEMAPELNMSGRLAELDETVREWIGLVAYRFMGRTGAFFPGP
ncbi:MAG: YdcF family protein [Geminicoccaceae bacterium]|nr:YdcF family protein [Geminicoccaceae bacterium]